MLEVEVSRANEQTKVNRSRKQERVRRSKIGWMGLGGAVAVEWVGGSGVGRSVAKWVGPWSQVPSYDWLEAGKKGRSDGGWWRQAQERQLGGRGC